MVKHGFLYLSLMLVSCGLYAQKFIDSLRKELAVAKEDSNKAQILGLIASYHAINQPDSNAYYAEKTKTLSKKVHYPLGLFIAGNSEFFTANLRADYPMALTIAMDNLNVAKSQPNDSLYYMAMVHLNLSLVHREMHDFVKAAAEVKEALRLQAASGKLDGSFWAGPYNQALLYKNKNRDSALYLMRKAYEMAKTASIASIYSSLATATLAGFYKDYGMYPDARNYYQEALSQAAYYDNVYIEARIYMNLMQYSIEINQIDSAIYFGVRSLRICDKHHYGDYASTVTDSLARIYESRGKFDSALKYAKQMQLAKDSIFGPKQIQNFLTVITENENRQKQAVAAHERLQERVKLYTSLAAVFIFILLSVILFLNNRQKQRSYAIIRKQKLETDLQRAKVEQAYQDLKSTQNQLIHSEKMASLGELMAGIAHEIQNPLNFVNNFSEVNKELIDEAKEAIKDSNPNEAVRLLLTLRENEEKISNHGKRADSIIKGMLQHSRETKGQKEPADINALANEYLRLSYQGLRAKDKTFTADLQTNFEATIGTINIIPQDIARVLLNLYNNAFYAVSEKKKHQPDDYEPSVSVSTKRIDGKLEIKVKDNGNGIPDKVIEKIFQPFFTTKPTGQGTGLGLSLSYDIIKAHSGEIKVLTNEGEYAEFIIQLPLN